ncbi:RNA polymerase sigma factor [Pseudoduganella aquatica]|uniref:RNA polymerase sigma factor n=1 Tax=Pseudoduganella aquatica TaxID=2660641 RepID=UPI001E55C66D|nr:RNA polymerase sigma factor [Pseudoduganella aquatica]
MLTRAVEEVCRREGGRVLAGLIRRFGDFSLAEDLLQDAYSKALECWPRDGLPANPAAWLTTVARNAGLDHVRRAARTLDDSSQALAQLAQEPAGDAEADFAPSAPAATTAPPASCVSPAGYKLAVDDDRLRLIFICCHPALAPGAQTALALRTLCGLSTREIARAYCETEATTAQRLVRAKRKIADARIPFIVPAPDQLPERLALVLQVIYLVFNEGYGATRGQRLVRTDLCREAIRLGRLMAELAPRDAEVQGLLALMLLQHARSGARVSAEGGLVTLESQDRSLWDGAAIAEGIAVLDAVLPLRQPGPYQVQAAIAALHGKAASAAATDWRQISALYGALLRYLPTPVVELNAAVALGMAHGPAQGLAWIARLEQGGQLAQFHYLHAAKAELLRRQGGAEANAAAIAAYARAYELTANAVELEYLRSRSAQLRQDGL